MVIRLEDNFYVSNVKYRRFPKWKNMFTPEAPMATVTVGLSIIAFIMWLKISYI